MTNLVTPTLIQLTHDATLKSFWRKGALRRFLLACGIPQEHLSSWMEDETKREYLDRLFNQLQESDAGKRKIFEIAHAIAEQQAFPDLGNWEDADTKIAAAKAALTSLRDYLKAQNDQLRNERERDDARKRAWDEKQKIQKTLASVETLGFEIKELQAKVGTSEGGYAFQVWFFKLLDFCEIQNRRPYVIDGRQIDGSLTLDGTTYLVELKFTADQAASTDIDSLRAKVEDKADNTMGIMVSINGYSSVAIRQASGRRTALLLIDATHLYMFLAGGLPFRDVILRVRRHASQTGQSYLESTKFSS